MSLELLPSQRLLRKDRLFFLFRRNRNEGCLNGRQDGGEGACVPLVEIHEGVGEVHHQLVGVDVGHGKGEKRRGKGRRGVVLEWQRSID